MHHRNNSRTMTSPTITQNQQTTSESHLVNNNNSTKILLAMAVGLELGDGEIFKGKFTEKLSSQS